MVLGSSERVEAQMAEVPIADYEEKDQQAQKVIPLKISLLYKIKKQSQKELVNSFPSRSQGTFCSIYKADKECWGEGCQCDLEPWGSWAM